MKNTRIAGISAAIALIGAAAFAHNGATGVVKERMEGMGVMGDGVKMIAPMMQGEIAYDAATVRSTAEEIRAHSGETLIKLFPEGSGGMPSEAKDLIWADWEQFKALAEQLDIYSEGLAMAAENGLALGGDEDADSGMMGGMMTDTMMGGDMMGAESPMMGVEELAEMPADAVFGMVSQTCAACHTRFRADSN